jgi:hypothetical protein
MWQDPMSWGLPPPPTGSMPARSAAHSDPKKRLVVFPEKKREELKAMLFGKLTTESSKKVKIYIHMRSDTMR